MAVSSARVGTSLSAGFVQKVQGAMSAWIFRNSGYRRLGLRREDLLMEEKPEVVEAIRRLPEQDQFLRLYRLKRALDLSMKHALLPQEQWTKQEEDIRYLSPLIEEVMKEMREKREWNSR